MSDLPFSLENLKNNLKAKGRLIPFASAQAAIENEQQTLNRDTKYLHPSEIAKRDWCPRSSMYDILGYAPEKTKSFGFQTLNIFQTGHDIHAKWQGWLQRSGILKEAELPIFSEEYHIKGSADGLLEDGNGQAILEIKSVGAGSVRFENFELYKEYETGQITHDGLWKKIRQPFSSHLRQLNLYMFCTGIHNGIFLYEWKATSAIKEFEVTFQRSIIEPILASCLLVKKALSNGTIVPRPIWAETIEHKTCKQCAHKEKCWKDPDHANGFPIIEHPSDAIVLTEVFTSRSSKGSDSTDTPALRRLVRK